MVRSLARRTPQDGEEHRVGAVDVRPQLAHGLDRRARYRREDVARLGEVRRARGVDDHSARPDEFQRPRQEVALERHEGVEVVGASPPTRLGTTAQCAEPGARSVDEDAVERPLCPRALAAVVLGDLDVRQPRGPPGGPARRGAAAARWRRAWRRAGRPARPAGRPCRPGRRTGRAIVRPARRRRRRRGRWRPAGIPRPARRRDLRARPGCHPGRRRRGCARRARAVRARPAARRARSVRAGRRA